MHGRITDTASPNAALQAPSSNPTSAPESLRSWGLPPALAWQACSRIGEKSWAGQLADLVVRANCLSTAAARLSFAVQSSMACALSQYYCLQNTMGATLFFGDKGLTLDLLLGAKGARSFDVVAGRWSFCAVSNLALNQAPYPTMLFSESRLSYDTVVWLCSALDSSAKYATQANQHLGAVSCMKIWVNA